MDPKTIDFIFPFFVLGYGLLITFVLSFPPLIRIAEEKLPADARDRLYSHRVLALVCLGVGAVWSLQNIWLN